jgi:transglutaminase-like putative cysteine protease
VTRRSFRIALDGPRPIAAVLLVGIASLTLTMTGQLLVWCVVAQGAMLVAAVVLRERPMAWQRSPLVLNLAMAVVSLVTAWIAFDTAASLIALAHFATLAQGLQLLDARPRRSEFLLVALALFQVILASNLTDSALFPPLLMAFLPTAVWTLLVHTLRTEAHEAGDPAAASRALTPGLLRVTLAASALSVLLGLALFLVLPRMSSGLVRGRLIGGPIATAGFSDRMELGDFGKIRGDPTVVMRVETARGLNLPAEARYWRGLAFDTFDGRSWSISHPQRSILSTDAELGVDLARDPGPSNLTQRILREPVTAGVVFTMGLPVHVEGSMGRLERDRNGGLYGPTRANERVRYVVESRWRGRNEAALRADQATVPGDDARWLALPKLAPQIATLALEAAGNGETDAERVLAIEGWLRSHGHYSDSPPPPDPSDPRSPIEHFLLGELSGHCEYFASAMVVLTRAIGIPARVVNGFAGGSENRFGSFVEVTRSDAHAWVEVHYARAGWVAYDPTPADLRLRAGALPSIGQRLYELQSALELWWFRNVVEFDRVDQLRALQAAWRVWHSLRSGAHAESRTEARPPPPVALIRWKAVALLCLALCAFGAATGWWWRHRGRSRKAPRVSPAYRTALRLLARRGLVRGPADTARGFASAAAKVLSPAGGAAFAALTERYLAERFGGRPPEGLGGQPGACLRALRDSLRA